jgi:DNA-binding NarL/FixJ family response regulator
MARKIAVVDDENRIRILCQQSLQKAGFEVRSFPSGVIALDELVDWFPEVIVMDYCMPKMNGFECMNRLKRNHPGLRFVLITGYSDWETVEHASVQGVGAMLSKPFSGGELVETVESVLNAPKNVHLTVRMMPQTDQGLGLTKQFAEKITARELEVLKLVKADLSNRRIARRLQIAENTVANHLANIYCKLECDNRLDAVRTYFSARPNDNRRRPE